MVDRTELAARFRRFGTVECLPDSPLYAALALGVAQDPDLLELAALTPPGQPPANLLLAAVQDLLFSGIDHPLGRFFPSVVDGPVATGDPVPALRDLCRTHHDALAQTMRRRRVQTNECGRMALLLPALHAIHTRVGAPLATVEVGASGGLNLLWPWASVDYGPAGRVGGEAGGLDLSCEVRSGTPPLPDRPPPAGQRLGLDQHPLDLGRDDTLRWLLALVWPEAHHRRARLRAAAALARRHLPDLHAGDLLQHLPALVARVPSDQHLVVLHSVVLYQVDAAGRAAFEATLLALSERRPLHRIGVEWLGSPTMELDCASYDRGTVHRTTLARVHPHGDWLEWLDQAVP